MSDIYAEIQVRTTKTVIITARCEAQPRRNGKAHDIQMDQPSAYYVICKTHQTKLEVSKLQAETVQDSESFCKKCLEKAAPVVRKLDPTTEALRRDLARAQGQLPKPKEQKRKWHVGSQFSDFINEIDIDL